MPARKRPVPTVEFPNQNPTPTSYVTYFTNSGITEEPEKVIEKSGKKRKVGIAYPAFVGSFKAVYPDIKVITDISELKNMDLIIFPGGEDVDPRMYDESNTLSYGVNPKRDEIEHRLFDFSYERMRNIKILGCCRGHQLIAVCLGSHLYQNFSSEKNPYTGEIFPQHPGNHPLDFNKEFTDTILKKFFSKDEQGNLVLVSSMHHQAVNNRSSAFIPVCSYEGIYEGFENNRIITTQFHPEFMVNSLSQSGIQASKFFKYLIEEW